MLSSAIRRVATTKARQPFNASRLIGTAITRIDQTTLPTMSQAVVHNNICYVSGQIDATGDDVESQTRNILEKIDTLLDQAGTDKSKLLTASIWLKDIETDFATMNKVWLEWVDDENKPARATTEANLAFPNLLVEVQVSAAIED
jgi:enamine deaminase RidA (YjgF/YER057c/UK114 family)